MISKGYVSYLRQVAFNQFYVHAHGPVYNGSRENTTLLLANFTSFPNSFTTTVLYLMHPLARTGEFRNTIKICQTHPTKHFDIQPSAQATVPESTSTDRKL